MRTLEGISPTRETIFTYFKKTSGRDLRAFQIIGASATWRFYGAGISCPLDLLLSRFCPLHRLIGSHRANRLLPGIFISAGFDVDAVLGSRQQRASTQATARCFVYTFALDPLQEIVHGSALYC